MALERVRRNGGGLALATPLLLVYGVVYLAAQVVFLQVAFRATTGRGTYDTTAWTLQNFARILTEPYYQNVLVSTALYGLYVTAICIVLGYPLAYLIVRRRRIGQVLMLVVVGSAFTATVVRALGWRLILGRNGPLNQLLAGLGIVDAPLALVDNLTGAVIATTSAVLPFMVLFLLPVIQAVDPQLEEAALGLGAGWGRAIYEVTVRQTLRGVLAGSTLVYAITVAAFTTPALVGGPLVPLLPIVIRQQVNTAHNHPLAAALAVVLAVAVLLFVWASQRAVGGRRSHAGA